MSSSYLRRRGRLLAIAALATCVLSIGEALAVPIECGMTLKAAISVPGEVDVFTFSAAGGETVAISTPGTIPQAPFRPCWQLYAAPLQPGDPVDPVGGMGCGLAIRTLPRAGQYVIQAFDGDGNDNTGSYSLTLE